MVALTSCFNSYSPLLATIPYTLLSTDFYTLCIWQAETTLQKMWNVKRRLRLVLLTISLTNSNTCDGKR